MSTEYHIARDEQKYGPYQLDEIRQHYKDGQLTETDFVWAEHLTEWIPLGTLPELAPTTTTGTNVPPPPPSADKGAPPVRSAVSAQQNAAMADLSARIASIKDQISSEGINAIPKLVDPKVLAAFAAFLLDQEWISSV